jgi:carboxymethylenebutenolidase
MAEHDDFFPPDAAKELESELQMMGVDCELVVHPGSGHAFMAPHNALGTKDQDLYDQIWPEATGFLHAQLGS